jgi:hypothetical protein
MTLNGPVDRTAVSLSPRTSRGWVRWPAIDAGQWLGSRLWRRHPPNSWIVRSRSLKESTRFCWQPRLVAWPTAATVIVFVDAHRARFAGCAVSPGDAPGWCADGPEHLLPGRAPPRSARSIMDDATPAEVTRYIRTPAIGRATQAPNQAPWDGPSSSDFRSRTSSAMSETFTQVEAIAITTTGNK